jgi:hypothetical protein
LTRRAGTLGGIVLLWLFAFASVAPAAPVHLFTEEAVIGGLNHACGVAVDSEGNVYVSSAGDSEIKILDPEHNPLQTIANVNEPCGLAVDSTGRLYVSEAGTGNVVRYTPDNYPFVGVPTHGAAEPIDSSGEAKGIAVDPVDDRLYVAKGTRIDTYDSAGNPGTSEISDEVQRVVPTNATGGTYKLCFEGQCTSDLAYEANHAAVQAALEALSTIGSGKVLVTDGPNEPFFEGREHKITFSGTLAETSLPQITCDDSGLAGASAICAVSTLEQGFSGHIGEDPLANYTGVAAYTYANGDLYLIVADTSTDQIRIFSHDHTSLSSGGIKTLRLRRTLDGPKAGEDFGFGAAGAYLAADQGTCPPAAKKACTAGHFFVYDHTHEVVNEFEASGEFLTQVSSPEPPFAFADAEPTAIAVDRSGGAGNGTLYVTSGAAAGAKVLAFGPLTAPSRSQHPDLSFKQESACGVGVDSHGNRYVAAGATIKVFPPTGNTPLTTISGAKNPCDVAVDSLGNVWALERGESGPGEQKAVFFAPASFPPVEGTAYGSATTCATGEPPFFPFTNVLVSIGIDPKDDHVFVSQPSRTIELDSAQNGCAVLNGNFAPRIGSQRGDVAVYGANGNVYIANADEILVLEEEGHEVFARISGVGSPKGSFENWTQGSLAVDQSNGHLMIFRPTRKVVEEYEASGSFLAEFGVFGSALRLPGVAVDNGAASPNKGMVYLAYDDPTLANPYDLTAFRPLSYGEPPIAVTGAATNLAMGNATLNGTVTPRGFEVEDCYFEYLTDAAYKANLEAEEPPFQGAEEAPCAESPAEIGDDTDPVAVHADVIGLDPNERYRFRLVAMNEFGQSEGKAALFGPPVITTKSAQPSYTEATLRALVDPSGLQTECHFEYGPSAAYGNATSKTILESDAGEVEVKVSLFELDEGTLYHFRALCENEAKVVQGPDQSFETLVRSEPLHCPNEEFRTGRSAALPDCRAYELVTPADTRGAVPFAAPAPSGGRQFNNWLTPPRGEGAGESVAYFIDGTLPGFEGNGREDGYRAARPTDEGLHPKEGWQSEVTGPSYLQAGGNQPDQLGVAADQEYWFWQVIPIEVFEGTLDGAYLRTPSGFEAVGQGSLGEDPDAVGRFLTPGATHVVFESDVGLEPNAPASGTRALYDRSPGGPTHVVSLKPGNTPFETGEDATFLGATEDGSAVAFEVEGTLYVRRGGEETVEVISAPYSFAGLSADGSRLFYTTGFAGTTPGTLHSFDLDSQLDTEIAEDSIFVNVSADGQAVYFTSEEVIDDENEGVAGEDNLYLWDGSGTRFIVVLDPTDLSNSSGQPGLNQWASFVSFGDGTTGRALNPSRTTPDGEVLVFESHADLTTYESEGHTQVYRYHAGDETIVCVSCTPLGTPPGGDAGLQDLDTFASPTQATTLVSNVTDDGLAVFFESEDSLLPEDANSAKDVYEWKASGDGETGKCELPKGCLALISSGQSDSDSFLYGMSADGHDVFFTTLETLHGADIPESPSVYDARKEGGIPDPPLTAPCEADACQGPGTPPPALPAPTSTGTVPPASKPSSRRCPKGKRKVRSGGKVRCVKKKRSARRGAPNRSQKRRASR